MERRTVQEALANSVFAKYVASNNAVAILDKIFDVVGGAAYHRRLPFERMYRDVRAGTVMPYNNRDAHRLLGQTVLGIENVPVNALGESVTGWRATSGVDDR